MEAGSDDGEADERRIAIRRRRDCRGGGPRDLLQTRRRSTRLRCRIAKAIWRRGAVSRSAKFSHASAAHEYFLESQSIFGPAGFTWSADSENCTDRLTQAELEDEEYREGDAEGSKRKGGNDQFVGRRDACSQTPPIADGMRPKRVGAPTASRHN